MSAPDLSVPLRAAIIAASAITGKLGSYQGGASVHTRRPVPEDAGYPLIICGPDVTISDQDGISDKRPVIVRDVVCYGHQPGDYREVEAVGYALRAMFHRQSHAITVPGWSVTDILATGPYPAPVDGDNFVGRRVTLTVRLYAK